MLANDEYSLMVMVLIKEDLVKKQADGLFHITEYGLMVLDQIPDFSFLKKHRKFFESHSLVKSGIPRKCLRRVGELEKCKTIDSITAVFPDAEKTRIISNCGWTTSKISATDEDYMKRVEGEKYG
jgi:predicted transcriptional regulator